MHILSPNLNAQIVILHTDTYFLLYTLTFLTIYLISHRFSSQNISLITIKWFFFSHFHNAYIFFHPHYHNVKKYYFNNGNGKYADESSWVLCKKKLFTLQFCIFDFVFWFRDEIWPFFKREFNKQIHTHTHTHKQKSSRCFMNEAGGFCFTQTSQDSQPNLKTQLQPLLLWF